MYGPRLTDNIREDRSGQTQDTDETPPSQPELEVVWRADPEADADADPWVAARLATPSSGAAFRSLTRRPWRWLTVPRLRPVKNIQAAMAHVAAEAAVSADTCDLLGTARGGLARMLGDTGPRHVVVKGLSLWASLSP